MLILDLHYNILYTVCSVCVCVCVCVCAYTEYLYTSWFFSSASVVLLMPSRQPFQKFIGIAPLSLLTNDVLTADRRIFINPQKCG